MEEILQKEHFAACADTAGTHGYRPQLVLGKDCILTEFFTVSYNAASLRWSSQ